MDSPQAASAEAPMLDRILLWCGVAAGPIFVVAFLVEGATRALYNPLRMPVSLLALGDAGWEQTLNFAVDGFLVVAAGVGIWRAVRRLGRPATAGPALIAIVGVGLLGAAAFPTDPGLGFPPEAPFSRSPGPTSGLHDLSSLVVFVGLPLSFLAFARWFASGGERRWARYARLAAAGFAVGFVLVLAGFNGVRSIAPVAGLMQRITIVIGWGFLAALGLHLLATLRRQTHSV